MVKDPTIKSELKELNASIAALSKDLPFALPSDYFEVFPQKIIEKIEYEALISKEPEFSKTLQSLKGHHPFEIPPHYFDAFQVKMPNSKKPIISLPYRKWAGIAAAACVAGMIIGTIFLNNKSKPSALLASHVISNEAIESYLTEIESLELGEKEGESFALENNTLIEVSPKSISDMLKDIPDLEISRFMDTSSYE